LSYTDQYKTTEKHVRKAAWLYLFYQILTHPVTAWHPSRGDFFNGHVATCPCIEQKRPLTCISGDL